MRRVGVGVARSGAREMRAIEPVLLHLHDVQVLFKLRAYAGARASTMQRFTATENSAIWNRFGWLAYMQAFGTQVFPVHHRIGMVGGIIPLLAVCLVLLVAANIAIANATGTTRTPAFDLRNPNDMEKRIATGEKED